jgi:hypothetical protein
VGHLKHCRTIRTPDARRETREITGALTVNLRAERSGSGSGRVYTILVEAQDASGNTTRERVTVSVPLFR